MPFEDGKSKEEGWQEFTRDMVEYRNQHAGNVEGWVVVEDGEIVSEWYNNRDGHNRNTRFHLWSGTKPITGMMLGMLNKDNKFTLNQTLRQLIPNRADDKRSEFEKYWSNNPRKAAIPVQDMLSMTSGLKAGTGSCHHKWAKCGGLDADAADNPSFDEARVGVWEYLYANNLLSYVMKTVSGKDPAEYARDVLFPLLGIEGFNWWRVTERFVGKGRGFQPISTALHGAMLTIRDYAKIGQFALQEGVPKPGVASKLPHWWGTLSVDHPTNGAYNAGFWYPNRMTQKQTEQSGYINGAMGKVLYWQKTPRGGRVIAIIHLDDLLDKQMNGQKCYSSHCMSYDGTGAHSQLGPDTGGDPGAQSGSGSGDQAVDMLEFALRTMC